MSIFGWVGKILYVDLSAGRPGLKTLAMTFMIRCLAVKAWLRT